MAAGSIVVDLLMRTGSFETDTKRAEKSLKELQKAAIETGKIIGAAFVASTAAISVFVKMQIDAADKMGEAAEKAGITAESLSALGYAAEMSGSTQDNMTSALIKLSKQMSEAAMGSESAKRAFESIGVSVLDASGNLKSADTVFKEVAQRFSEIPNGVEKTSAAIDIFGKSGADLIPTLNNGADGLQAMANEAQRLGVIIDTETAKASGEFNDNIDKLQKALAGLALTIGKEVLPVMIQITDVINEFNSSQNTASAIGQAFKVVFETIAVVAANVVYVLTAIGKEIGGIAGQLMAVAQLDFRLAKTIGEVMKEDATKARIEIDKLTQSILNASSARQSLNDGKNNSLPKPKTFKSFKSDNLPKTTSKVVDDFGKELKKTTADREKLLLEDEMEIFRERNKIMDEGRRVYEQTRTPIEKLNMEYERLNKLLEAGAINQDTYSRAVFDAMEAFDATNKKMEESNKLAQELGMTFTSAFEDAIVAGTGLSDTLRGLAQDLLRIATRKLITEPLGAAFTSALGGMFGGAKAGGGDVIEGRAYLVGENGPEMFTPRTTGTITPSGATGGATIVQNINVSTGVQQTVRAEILSLMPQIAASAKAAVADAKLRGGAYAAALR